MWYQSLKHVTRVVVVVIMTEALGKAFRFTKFETSVIENVAAVPVFVAKRESFDRAKAE
jgi:hypothetical protein